MPAFRGGAGGRRLSRRRDGAPLPRAGRRARRRAMLRACREQGAFCRAQHGAFRCARGIRAVHGCRRPAGSRPFRGPLGKRARACPRHGGFRRKGGLLHGGGRAFVFPRRDGRPLRLQLARGHRARGAGFGEGDASGVCMEQAVPPHVLAGARPVLPGRRARGGHPLQRRGRPACRGARRAGRAVLPLCAPARRAKEPHGALPAALLRAEFPARGGHVRPVPRIRHLRCRGAGRSGGDIREIRLSALWRNRDPRAGLSRKERAEWLDAFFEFPLSRELVLAARPEGAFAKASAFLFRHRAKRLLLAEAAVVDFANRHVSSLFTRARQSR